MNRRARPSAPSRRRWFAWKPRPVRPGSRRRDLGTYAEGIRVQEVQGRSGAILRPGGIAYDIEHELDAYGDELADIEKALGLRASRAADARVAGYGPQADGARDLAARTLPEYEAALVANTTAQNDLTSFVRRRPKGGTRYRLTRLGLLGADTGAVLGALVYVGELPLLALGTALAVGLSAVTAGMLGSDVRELKLARDRRALVEAEEVDPALVGRYPRLFGAPRKDRDTYRLAMLWGLLSVVSIAVGVFALRAAIEGLLGLVFGAFAVAVALASFISSWAHGDDVADLLEVYAERAMAAKTEYRTHLMAREPSEQAVWQAEADSIRAEHQAIGQSKADAVRGLKHAAYRNNRQVFGDGTTEHRVLRPVVTDDEIDRILSRGTSNHFENNGEPSF